jgi:hypothetical protein
LSGCLFAVVFCLWLFVGVCGCLVVCWLTKQIIHIGKKKTPLTCESTPLSGCVFAVVCGYLLAKKKKIIHREKKKTSLTPLACESTPLFVVVCGCLWLFVCVCGCLVVCWLKKKIIHIGKKKKPLTCESTPLSGCVFAVVCGYLLAKKKN